MFLACEQRLALDFFQCTEGSHTRTNIMADLSARGELLQTSRSLLYHALVFYSPLNQKISHLHEYQISKEMLKDQKEEINT